MSRLAIRLPDRRLGFSRRRAEIGRARNLSSRLLARYRARPRALAAVLVSVVVLNITDLLLTLRALELGAVELNPIVAALIDADPLMASLFKATIVLFVVGVMWTTRRYRRVLEASLLLLVGFALLTAYSGSMLMLAR